MEQVTRACLTLQQRSKRASSRSKTIFPRNLGTLFALMLIAKVIRAVPSETTATTTKQSQDAQQQLFSNLTLSCTARECDDAINRQHLRTILNNMKPSADPCDDFHEYACGNWRHLHTNGTTSMKLAEKALMKKYIDLFERWQQDEQNEVIADTESKTLNEVQKKMLKYYKVCRSLEQSGRPTLAGYLQQLTEDANLWRLQDFNWLKTVAELGRYGYSSNFVDFMMHDHNATFMQLKIMPHSDHKRLKWSAEIGEALSGYTTGQQGEALGAALRQFELQLLRLIRDYDGEIVESEITLAELSAETAQQSLQWQYYASKILERQLQPTHRIHVENLLKIKEIAQFLEKQEPETLMLYTMARFLNYLQDQKTPNFLDAETAATGFNCLKHMTKIHFVAMNYVYELEYYSKERATSDPVIQNIFKRIKDEFNVFLLNNAMNLSAPQLEQLVRKLSDMRLNIGNLPINVTPTFYSDLVSNLNVSSQNFYHNHLQGLKHFYGFFHSKFDMADQSLSSPMHSFSLNEPDYPDMLYISPVYFINMIVIPFAYLEVPFFSAHFSDILLYGDLANTLGHELIHGFDSNFIRYDASGSENKILESILENVNFTQNSECLEVGTEFLSERIADVSGIKLTIAAFMKRNPPLMPQEWRLYFMQFAQFFCGSTDLASFRAEDPYHDMDNLRLNYVLAQTPEFAEIYECPVGSAMHPQSRCQMW